MAPKSAGSSPASPTFMYNVNSYIANHFNILNSKKIPRITVKCTSKTLKLVNTLYLNRIIQGYIIDTTAKAKYITFNSHYYRGIPYFSHFKIVSTPSKPQIISSRALNISTKSIGKSLIILETDKGIITHTEAIKYNIGGRILGVIS